ncbi:DALR anticodon-binding domain-containing protein 3 isoform X2 [Felis catus]|uniref:DALR anticodon-binding domain-containing protein 3 isoform X2 n=1 Tax=Felis catus TaxID=9685 RepID=UPI001D19D494|nr:DALR anticodon-binding domain-containing protein 3 isoform X2 [Felis catus]
MDPEISEPRPGRADRPRRGRAGAEGRKRLSRFPLAHLSAQGPPPDTRPGLSVLPEVRPPGVLLPVLLFPSGRHGDGAPGGRRDTRGPQHGPGAWRPRVVQGDARPPPACPRLPGAAARITSALRGRTGARACGPCSRRPAGPRRGPGAALRADPRGSGAPAAAARRLRARARRRGRLCRARRARRAGPARPPPLPGAAQRPRRAPPEPAARRARGRSFGANSARSRQLRVDWPAASERAATEALRNRALAELSPAQERGALPRGVLGTVCLKELVQERGRAAGYDPNLDKCLVTEDLLSVLAELQEAARCWPGDSPPSLAAVPDANADRCMVVHVVSCEEEFQQQKVDLLWRKLDDQAPLTQKHLVCGPVKVAGAPGTLTAPEYYELRHAQVCKASAAKHGRDLAQDPAWTEVFSVLSVATIKFEMLSTAPHGQLLLALADSSISTKGTKSGTFVMYNCARLATLFEGYRHSMERGLYPTFPPVSSLDFSLLQDEGEWLLLFNGILPFPDLLSQTAALACTAPGLHTTARTETMCKFLVQLSMDFSSYYNRIHILGAPRPHLFGQMFARLQLLRAVREVLHTGLATLGLPPLDHI